MLEIFGSRKYIQTERIQTCFCCSGVLAVALLLLRSLTDGEDSVLAIIILLIVVDHDELAGDHFALGITSSPPKQ